MITHILVDTWEIILLYYLNTTTLGIQFSQLTHNFSQIIRHQHFIYTPVSRGKLLEIRFETKKDIHKIKDLNNPYYCL